MEPFVWSREFLTSGAFLRLNQSWAFSSGGFYSEKPSPSTPCFYRPDFYLESKKPWWIPEKLSFFDEFPEPRAKSYSKKNPHPQWQMPSKKDFFSQMTWIQKKFEKAVPFVFETANFSVTHKQREDWVLEIKKKEERVKDQYPYGFWSDGDGVIGVSPEILLEKKGLRVKSMALAGTSSYEKKDLLIKDKKEIKEHEIVKSFIEKKLKPFGKVTLSKTYIQPILSLAHLRADVELILDKDIEIETLVKALHPTPALLGEPEREVKEFFQKTSPQNKKWAAPFGLLIPEKKEFFAVISIRNLTWNPSTLKVGSGCGILPESQPEKEWKELEMKRRLVKDFFCMS